MFLEDRRRDTNKKRIEAVIQKEINLAPWKKEPASRSGKQLYIYGVQIATGSRLSSGWQSPRAHNCHKQQGTWASKYLAEIQNFEGILDPKKQEKQ